MMKGQAMMGTPASLAALLTALTSSMASVLLAEVSQPQISSVTT